MARFSQLGFLTALSFPAVALTNGHIHLTDIKRIWQGPRATFEFKTNDLTRIGKGWPSQLTAIVPPPLNLIFKDGVAADYWTVLLHDDDIVPIFQDTDGHKVVARVRLVESGSTTITYSLEAHWLQFHIEVHKPASRLTLDDVKAHFPGPFGVFLFKTPEGEGAFHWTVIIDNFTTIPCFEEGKVFVQIKMKGFPKSVVQFEHDDGSTTFLRLPKAATKVTLNDIKPFSENVNGIFHFKVADVGGAAWAAWIDDSVAVPSFSQDLIVCKVKPFGRFAVQAARELAPQFRTMI